MSRFLITLAMSAIFFPACIFGAAPARAASPVVDVAPTRLAIGAYAKVLRSYNPQLPAWQSKALAEHAIRTSAQLHIDVNMLVALVSVESSWHTQAQSWAGAVGLGQLMPATAARLGVNPYDPIQNITGAAHYLSGLLTRFAGKPNSPILAFAAYTAGPKAVIEYDGVPPFAETQRYVSKVMRAWKHVAKIVHVPVVRIHVAAADRAEFNYWTGTNTH